jgi:hypothetical protein
LTKLAGKMLDRKPVRVIGTEETQLSTRADQSWGPSVHIACGVPPASFEAYSDISDRQDVYELGRT